MGGKSRRPASSRGVLSVLALGGAITLAALAVIAATRWLRRIATDAGSASPAPWPVIEAQAGVMRFADDGSLLAVDDGGGAEPTHAFTRLASAAAVVLQRVVLQCPEYAGPLIYAWFPGWRNLRTRAVAGGRLDAPTELRPVELAMAPFALGEVTLLPGSRFHAAAETNRAFLEALDADRLLFSFRAHHGLPQPPGAGGRPLKPYGGWEAPHSGIRGHFVGHFLSALAMQAAAEPGGSLARKGRYAYSCGQGGRAGPHLRGLPAPHRPRTPALTHPRAARAACVRRARRYMVEVLADCAGARGGGGDAHGGFGGYVSAFSQSELDKHDEHCAVNGCTWVGYYTMHKILQGLLDQHVLARAPDALDVASGLGRYLCKRARAVVDRRGLQWWLDGLALEVGGMAEALVQLARVLGAEPAAEWLQCAALFERPCFTSALALAGAVASGGRVHGGGAGGGPGASGPGASGPVSYTHLTLPTKRIV